MGILDTVAVVKLNDKNVSLEEILKISISKGNLDFIKDAVQTILINDAAVSEGVTISNEELQNAADDFRQKHGLQSTQATNEWLKNNFMTIDDFESRQKSNLLQQKLKQKIVAGQEEKYFAENSTQFQSAVLSQIVIKDEDLADEILSQIEDEEEAFESLAKKYSIDASSKPAGGYIGHVYRNKLSAPVQVAVFGGDEGDVIGPIKTDQGFHIIRIEQLGENRLNDSLKKTIADRLFADYVANLYSKSVSGWKLLDAI